MDSLSILGILIAISAILMGQQLEGGQISSLLNTPAMLIVMGGTLGAVLLETPNALFRRSMKMLPWILFPPRFSPDHALEELTHWSMIARREGFLGLEAILYQEVHPFAKKAVQLLIDGGSSATIREAMEVDLESCEAQDLKAAKVFESMGGYAPTIGILGAVLGLIHVMGNLADPAKLGPGIAVAFVATVYGVGLANLLFIPIGKKLENLVLSESLYKEMILQGMLSISEGENPKVLEIKLQGFLEK